MRVLSEEFDNSPLLGFIRWMQPDSRRAQLQVSLFHRRFDISDCEYGAEDWEFHEERDSKPRDSLPSRILGL